MSRRKMVMADIYGSPSYARRFEMSLNDRANDQQSRAKPGVRFSSMGSTTDNPNYTHPFETMDNLVDQYNKQPLTYSTGANGQTTVTRSMNKPQAPLGMSQYPAFSKYFGEGQLSNSWILPQGAMSGPRFTTRNLPSTDQTRQQGFNTGMTNSSPNVAQVNQQNYWPDSSFKMPYSTPTDGSPTPMPIFGATIDYASGRWRTPQGVTDGAPYGRFETQRKTNPTNFSRAFK